MRDRRAGFVTAVGAVAALFVAAGFIAPTTTEPMLSHSSRAASIDPGIERPSPVAESACAPGGGTSCPMAAAPGRTGPAAALAASTYPSWNPITPGTKPPATGGAAMVFDPATGSDVMFGGGVGSVAGSYTYWVDNFTYAFSPATNDWTNLSTHHAPPASDGWTLAYDPVDGVVLAVGGDTNETWTFAGGTWTELGNAVHPPTLYAPCLAWDSEDGYALLFGGELGTSSAYSASTWSFVHGAWVNRTTLVGPAGAMGCSLTDDLAAHAMLLFGGYAYVPSSGGPVTYNATWLFAAGSWTSVASPASPWSRYDAAVTYLGGCNCVMLYGGFYFYYGYGGGFDEGTRADTWVFDAGAWRTLPTAQNPAGGGGAQFAIASNPVPDEVVLFGGFSYSGLLGQTWLFTPPIRVNVSAPPHGLVDAGRLVTISASASGGPGGFVFHWTGAPVGCTGSGTPDLACDFSGPQLVNPSVVVTDQNGIEGAAAVAVTVFPALTLTLAAPLDELDVGQNITLVASATGGAGDDAFDWSGLAGMTCQPPQLSGNSSSAACGVNASGAFIVGVEVVDRTGAGDNATALDLSAFDALVVGGVAATPSPAVVGASFTLTVNASQGAPPESFTYGGLPPGCLSSDVRTLQCVPSTVGTFHVTVEVGDAAGAVRNVSTTVTVQSAPAASSGSVLGGVPVVLLGVGIAAAAAVGIGALVLVRGGRHGRAARRPRAAPPARRAR